MAPAPSRIERPRDADKALLIAIAYNTPERPPVRPLVTTIGDAEAVRDHLLHRGYLAHNIIFLRDDSHEASLLPTRPNILRAMGEFMEGIKQGDRRFFFYGGHGYQIVCNENTEEDDLDEAILPHGHNGEPRDEEGKPLDPSKVAGLPSNHPDKKKLEGIITDNMLREHLVNKLLPGCRLIAVFETCHSGTMLDLDFHWIYEPNIDRYVTTPSRVRRQMMPRLTLSDRDGALKPRNDSREDHDYTVDGQAIPRCSSPETESAPEVYCIASAEDSQRSWGYGNMTMTRTLLDILNSAVTKLTIRELMRKLRETMGHLRVASFRSSMASADSTLKRSKTSIERCCEKLRSIQFPQFGSLVRTTPDKHFSI